MVSRKKDARYEVFDVWGYMVGRVKKGDVLVDYYEGEKRHWHILCGEQEGGMSGMFVGHRHPEPLDGDKEQNERPPSRCVVCGEWLEFCTCQVEPLDGSEGGK